MGLDSVSNKENKNQLAIVLGILDFIYLFASIILINPGLYLDTENGTYMFGYGTSALVYTFGIIFPFLAKVIKGDKPDSHFLRAADIFALAFAVLSFCGILIYYIWHAENWVAWFSYIMALLTSGPSLFSVILSAREYINKD